MGYIVMKLNSFIFGVLCLLTQNLVLDHVFRYQEEKLILRSEREHRLLTITSCIQVQRLKKGDCFK